jgi:acetylornithine/succinyldiaminopimelate/putrescine aminotransferase
LREKEPIMTDRKQSFGPHLAQTSDFPLAFEVERAEGVYLYDKEGRPYLDLISGISVNNTGHCHPAVVEAIRSQAGKYLHTMVYGEHVQEPQIRLAEAISKELPEGLDQVYFTNSGSEAVEGALKLAKRHTRRHGIIALRNAYHGSTLGALSVMGNETFKNAFRPMSPGVRFIDINQEEGLEKICRQTACVIIEPVQGEAGIIPAQKEWLAKVRHRCNETGALLVLDEVQTGFGRTGSLFAFQRYGVQPDVLVMAKGMGGGMPLGGFAASAGLMKSLRNDPILGHITTFGGHPVSCAAALASLQVILEGRLPAQAPGKMQAFLDKLAHKDIKQVRHAGLMGAIELDSAQRAEKTIQALMKRGIITDWFLFNDRSLRVAPPLIISHQQMERAALALNEALDETA